MSITSTPVLAAHSIRITVRIHVGSWRREADLSLPTSASLAEAQAEILDLCEAPPIDRPWRMSTAGGAPLDPFSPLFSTPLEQGSVLIFTPAEPVDAPIIRDSASTLAHLIGHAGARSGPQAAVIAGLACLILLLSLALPLPWAFALGTAVGGVACLWDRSAEAVGLATIACASAAGALLSSPSSLADAPFAALSAAATGGTTLLVLTVLGVTHARATSALSSLAGLILLGGAGFSTLGPAAAAPTAALGCLLLILIGPAWAISLAGLEVPVLPTPGEDLSASDAEPEDVDKRARRAAHIHEGIALATSAVGSISLLALSTQANWWAQLGCLAFAGAVLLHAARHRAPLPAWSLVILGISAISASVLSVVLAENPHLARTSLAALCTLACLTALVWAPRVPALAPTRMVWLERAEALSLIATVPLLIHLMGVFILIRGLG